MNELPLRTVAERRISAAASSTSLNGTMREDVGA